MSRRIVDSGRMEIRGAQIRFKQKGTLEAFDRNVADLQRVFVRSTPAPDIRLFADFVFESDVFRVWQESTLVNYKEFLEKVEFAGLENFRALMRYTTRAGGPDLLDPTSRAFAESNAPPERFVNKDELGDYDHALSRGDAAAPGRGIVKTPAATAASADRDRAAQRAAVEEAWNQLAPQLAAEEQKTREEAKGVVPLAGGMLVLLGLVTATLVIQSFRNALRIQAANPDAGRASVTLVFVVGGLIAMGFLLLGGVYLVRASRSKRPDTSRVS